MKHGKLQLIATPIGNLKDISYRAVEALKASDLILCEDTRVTSKLLKNFEISRPLLSYHHHSSRDKIRKIEGFLKEGKVLSLVTDAGTPGISDPGNNLIEELLKSSSDFKIEPIPGPCALIAGLSISGFPTDKFVFLGFPPHKNKRQKFFQEIAQSKLTTVFYESSHRIRKCLSELKKYLEPKAKIVVCRELTKIYETIYRGTIDEVIEKMKEERGEFVVIVKNY